MTSHRRRKCESMPYSVKDKKCDVTHGKEKSDGKGGQNLPGKGGQNLPLPLLQKSVYIDIKNGKQAEVMEGQLKKLGAVVEKFLSREVNYVISSSAPPTRIEEGHSNGDNPQSPSFANVPSPFSSIPSPTAPSDTKAPVVSRGKALAQIAYARSRASTVVANAERWGIKVVSHEAASKWLEKELKKLEKENEKESTKKENEVQKPKKVVKRKRKVLKGCYVKFEAINRMYRPMKIELERWPKLNVLSPPGLNSFSEVKINLKHFHRRHSSLRNGKASFSTSSGKANLRKANSMSSIKESISAMTTFQATPDIVAVPITTTGDVKRHFEFPQRKRPDKLQGYCECCRMKYKDMNKHVKEEEHQSYARDKSNYESLDALIKRVPSTIQFLQDVLLKHCAQKQTETVPSDSSDSHEISTDLDVAKPVIPAVPREATPPRNFEGIKPVVVWSPNRSKFTVNSVKLHSVSQVESEDLNTTDDTRPQAVVIRRPTPSGIFVSPRRRVPTPSKKPWMQERSMVFRDSPMASLQPSDVCNSIDFMVGESFLGCSGKSSNPNCDQSKKKSIVRSLLNMPDFVSSSGSFSEDERFSEMIKEKGTPISKSQKSCSIDITKAKSISFKQENLPEVDFQCDKNLDSTAVKVHLENIMEDRLEVPLDVEKSSKVNISPDFFMPCIADRVKRRTRASNIGVSQNDHVDSDFVDNHTSPHKKDTMVASFGHDDSVSVTLKEDQHSDQELENEEMPGSLDSVGDNVDKVNSVRKELAISENDTVDYVPSLNPISDGNEVNVNYVEIPYQQILISNENGSSCLIKDSNDTASDLNSPKVKNTTRSRRASKSQNTQISKEDELAQFPDNDSKGDKKDNEMGENSYHTSNNQCLQPTIESVEIEGKEDNMIGGQEETSKITNVQTDESNVSKNVCEDLPVGDQFVKDPKHRKKAGKRRRSKSAVTDSNSESNIRANFSTNDRQSLSEDRGKEDNVVGGHEEMSKPANVQKDESTNEDFKCSSNVSKNVCEDLPVGDQFVKDPKHRKKAGKRRRSKSAVIDSNSESNIRANFSTNDMQSLSEDRGKEDNMVGGQEEMSKPANVQKDESTNEDFKCPSDVSKNVCEDLPVGDQFVNDPKHRKKAGKRRRSKSAVTDSNKESNVKTNFSMNDKRSLSEDRGLKESSKNGAVLVRSRARQCKLFVHEGMYANDGEGIDLPNLHNVEMTKSDLIRSWESTEAPLTKSDQNYSNISVNDADVETSSLNDECNDKIISSVKNLSHFGKRIFRGKKFHSTNANWDVKNGDDDDLIGDCVGEPVTPNIAECVKKRRSCTLYNHDSQYANDVEWELNKSADNTDENPSNNKTNPSDNQVLSHAVVVRRTPSAGVLLTKRDTSWCKYMSKKDWMQLEDDANAPVNHEDLEHDISGTEDVCADMKETVTHRCCRKKHPNTLERTDLQMTIPRSDTDCEGLKTPEKGRSSNSHRKYKHRGKYTESNEGKVHKIFTQSGTLFNSATTKDCNEKERTGSPRIRLKIKRDSNDCYSSTLGEDQDVDNIKSVELLGTTSNKVKGNMFSSPFRISKELGSPNEYSDSIDLLETPRRGRKNSECTPISKLPVKSLKLSPLQTPCRDKDCTPTKTDSLKYDKSLSLTPLLKKKRKLSDVYEMETKNVNETIMTSFSRANELPEDIYQFIPKPSKRRHIENIDSVTDLDKNSQQNAKLKKRTSEIVAHSSSRERKGERKHEKRDKQTFPLGDKDNESIMSTGKSCSKSNSKYSVTDLDKNSQQNAKHKKPTSEIVAHSSSRERKNERKHEKRDKQTFPLGDKDNESIMSTGKSCSKSNSEYSVTDLDKNSQQNAKHKKRTSEIVEHSSSRERKGERKHEKRDKQTFPLGDEDNESIMSTGKSCSKSNSKSRKRESKRKLSVSDCASTTQSSKKVKLNESSEILCEFVKEPGSRPSFPVSYSKVHCTQDKNEDYLNGYKKNLHNDHKESKNGEKLDKELVKNDEVSNDRFNSETSGNNVGDLLNFIPNLSSPGKSNSSWDDAFDSYLNTSLKHSDQTGKRYAFTPNSIGSVLCSPFKHSATKSGDAIQNDVQLRNESGNRSTQGIVGNSDCLLTPTKRNKSHLSLEGSPLVQKIDSVISFNHMSPQHLHFSPIKNNPVQSSERSPVVQKIDSVISFNHMSPQRLHFSPRKSELQNEKTGKLSVRKQL